MWIPKKEIKIPIDKMEKIEEVKSFLGKSKFRPLLKIGYIDENGQKNSAAWMVKNLQKWKSIINEVK
jgi:hypothetical protein